MQFCPLAQSFAAWQGLPVSSSGALAHDLSVFVVDMGYALALDRKHVGKSCGRGAEGGIAVPLVGAELDVAGLAACAAKLLPAGERSTATIAANPQIPYSDIVATAEALTPLRVVQFGLSR
jgi:hypothetical protein